MKKLLLTTAALLAFSFANAQDRPKTTTPANKEVTPTITEADKAKVRDDIKRRREQNKVEMEKARKVVKERISADTIRNK